LSKKPEKHAPNLAAAWLKTTKNKFTFAIIDAEKRIFKFGVEFGSRMK